MAFFEAGFATAFGLADAVFEAAVRLVTFARALASSACRHLKIDPAPVLGQIPAAITPVLGDSPQTINAPFKAAGDAPLPGALSWAARPVPLIVAALLVAALAVYFWPSAPPVASGDGLMPPPASEGPGAGEPTVAQAPVEPASTPAVTEPAAQPAVAATFQPRLMTLNIASIASFATPTPTPAPTPTRTATLAATPMLLSTPLMTTTALSAVTAGVKDVREAVAEAERERGRGRRTLLFLDEIHRFNKAQQDALLPHVESGLLTLIGATTENPGFEVNPALRSRSRTGGASALEWMAVCGSGILNEAGELKCRRPDPQRASRRS